MEKGQKGEREREREEGNDEEGDGEKERKKEEESRPVGPTYTDSCTLYATR